MNPNRYLRKTHKIKIPILLKWYGNHIFVMGREACAAIEIDSETSSFIYRPKYVEDPLVAKTWQEWGFDRTVVDPDPTPEILNDAWVENLPFFDEVDTRLTPGRCYNESVRRHKRRAFKRLKKERKYAFKRRGAGST
jgi:hypothetical protein